MTGQQITDALSMITGTISSIFTPAIFTTFPINLIVGAGIASIAIWLISELVDVIRKPKEQKD